jgi:hypothetical protein
MDWRAIDDDRLALRIEEAQQAYNRRQLQAKIDYWLGHIIDYSFMPSEVAYAQDSIASLAKELASI